MLVSPTLGTLVECDGGSGASFGGVDSYSGGPVAGNLGGALTGSANPPFPSPNRVAAGPYASPNSPGACDPSQYGIAWEGQHHR